MRKAYVLDTNVLLYDPFAFEKFEDNIVIIPSVVLEELDNFKKYFDLRGFNARQVSRKLDNYIQTTDTTIDDGILLKNGGILKIQFYDPSINLPKEFQLGSSNESRVNDNIILNTCLTVKNSKIQGVEYHDTILISKDINMRIKANYLGIQAEDYRNTKIENSIQINGSYLVASEQTLDQLYKDKYIYFDKQLFIRSDDQPLEPFNNEYFLIKCETNDKKSALVIYKQVGNVKTFELLNDIKSVFGIHPKNYKQHFVTHSVLDPDIDICFIMGIAGSGKTLITLAASLELVLNGIYEKLIIGRPIIPLGKDPGALPGDALEKTRPWLQPIYDNLDFILRSIKSGKYDGDIDTKQLTIEYLEKSGMIEIQPLAYMRGRSLTNCIFIVDEAQNLSPHEVKTLISRIGFNSKIILTGDIYQIDNPYLTPQDNGLTYMSEKFRIGGYKKYSTIYLDKGERSELATFVANIL
jgi:PhoH-like ATPase